MRMSHVLLAGVAVAATAAATSAFTASNDVQDSVAGFDTSTVTGATTKHINYVLNGTNKAVVDSIQFELNENLDAAVVEGLQAWLTLKNANGGTVGVAIQCTIGAFTTVTPVACDTTGTLLETFNGVALTVAE
jgi:hypothetical protein